MQDKSFASDPAFLGIPIAVQPIPPMNGCPLGLYDPNTGAITLSPDANSTHTVLLHELGHRHGDYYHNNLSEKYAEVFRRKHQKNSVLLYEGRDINTLPHFEVLFEEGERGAVEIFLEHPMPPDDLYNFKRQVCSYNKPGERLPRFFYGDGAHPFIRVQFVKGVNWMVIIGSVTAAFLVSTAGIMGYSIYKTAQERPWMVPFLLFGTMLSSISIAAIKQERARERIRR